MRSNFLGGAYKLRSLPLAAQTCVNLYVEPNESGNGDVGAFYGTPGLVRLAELPTSGCRGLRAAGGYLWGVYGNSLYRISSAWEWTLVGELPNYSGAVGMDDNGTSLVVAHINGWHAVTMADLTFAYVEDSPTMSDVSFIDNYLVGAAENGTYVWANLNSTTIDALSFASAEGSPDRIIRTIADHRELWLFGTESVEVAVVTSDPDLPFTRTSYIEQGILAPRSAAKEDNSVFWLGANRSGQGVVFVARGYVPERISTFAIEQQIASYANPELATGYTYQQDGHHFYILCFEEATWAYDINTGVWAQRGWREPDSGVLQRHRGVAHAFFRGEHVLGDHEDGRLYALDLDTYSDDGDPIYRERAWHQQDAERHWITFHRGELVGDMGVGNGARPPLTVYLQDEEGNFLTTETGELILLEESSQFGEAGSNPKVWLAWSDNGGRSWTNSHDRTIGQLGDFRRRAVWRRMGKSSNRYFRLWTAEPVRIAWHGFNLDMDVSNG